MPKFTNYRTTNSHEAAMTQAYNDGVEARSAGLNISANPDPLIPGAGDKWSAWNWGYEGDGQALTDRLDADKGQGRGFRTVY